MLRRSPRRSRQTLSRKSVRGACKRNLRLESLESKIVLTASGFAGNECAPDLDLSAVAEQQAVVGQQLTFNIFDAGGTVEDLDLSGTPTGDTIRILLDPDVGTDTPLGATITEQGVFSWTPTAGQEGTFQIIVIAVDQGTPPLADAEVFTITVSGNEAPAVDLNGDGTGIDFSGSFTEDGGPVAAVDATLSVTDTDDANIQSATIVLTNRPDGDDEILAVDTTGTNIVAASYNPATGELLLTGSDTFENYQAVLRTLTYDNASQNPDDTDRLIEVTVNDGVSDSPVATSTISITPENDAPELDLNGDDSGIDFAATFTEDGGPVVIVDTDLDIADVDDTEIAAATATITNLQDGTDEVLAVDTDGTSITALYDSGTGILTLTGPATTEDFELVLQTLTYENTSQNPDDTPRQIEIVVNDGDSDSPVATSVVTVVGQNDSPDIAEVSDQTATVGVELQITVTATDPDGDDLVFQLDTDAPSANIPASATLNQIDNNTAVISWTPQAGDGAGPFVFVVLVTDDDATTPLSDQESFTVTLSNDPPAVDLNGGDGGTGFSATFVEDGGPVAIVDTDLSVTDTDSADMSSATVTITNLQDGDSEVLEVDTTNTSITAIYDDLTGVLTLSGVDSRENYEQVLRTLTYDNTSQDPTVGDRTVEVVVNDGFSDSTARVSTVTVNAENDSPNLELPDPFDTGSPVTVEVDTEVTFTATVIDPDNTDAELTFFLDLEDTGIPQEIAQPTISSSPGPQPWGVLSWTPTQTGTFTILVIVTDADGLADQESFVLEVVAPAASTSIEGEPTPDDEFDAALSEVLEEEWG